MNERQDQLERLISRFLDDEARADERRALRETLRQDAHAHALFEEHSALDREIGTAMRRAMRRGVRGSARRAWWLSVARNLALATAACIGAAVWMRPAAPQTPAERQRAGRTEAASWFAPPVEAGDQLRDSTARYERPAVGVVAPSENWIVVPGERPGEFLVVEVQRVRTRTLPIQQDF